MTRPTIVYVVMIGLCALGIWAIIDSGAGRAAPPDLAGDWELTPAGSAHAGPRQRLTIEQSGLFLRIARDGGARADYRLAPIHEGDDGYEIELRGPTIYRVRGGAADNPVEMWTPDSAGAATGEKYLARRAASSAESEPGDSRKTVPVRHTLFLLLAQLTVIIAATQVMGYLFTRIGQPRVMGEMVAGILLGPSLLGWLMPDVSQAIFHPDSLGYLGAISQVGVIFFLFLVGLELDAGLVRSRGHAAVVISHVSIIAPLVLGTLLAVELYPLVFNNSPRMQFSSVALFMGAAMSVTAFPVLARILIERKLHKTQVGAVAITCAAVDDLTAWCLLAFVVGFVRSSGMGSALMTAGMSAAYVVGMLLIVRPLLRQLQSAADRQGRQSRGVTALVFFLVLASAMTTEAIGIHALFGAFLLGAIMPRSLRFAGELTQKIEDFTVLLLLPIFFAYTGLKTQVGLLNSPELWWQTALVILVACAGKFGGSTLAGRACGMSWRESSAIGILMNTRGLMQLVILNVGRELGVITDAVFAMMVLMAIVTTFLTTPVLNWVYPERLLRASAPGAKNGRFGVLVPVSMPRTGPPLLLLADIVGGCSDQLRRIVGLHLRPAVEQDAYRAAAGPATDEPAEPLAALIHHGERQGVHVEALSRVSGDPAMDISQVAEEQHVQLILMGFHNPIWGQAVLGGTVHRVLRQARTNVGVFVDRGMHERPRTILVPYLGSVHDRYAMEIAARMARHAGAAITVLHVVPPKSKPESESREKLGAQGITDRVFADPTQPAPVSFRIYEHLDPISAVLEQAKPFDLVVIGVGEEWGLTSHLFGWRAERIARDCPSPLLILRKHIDDQPAAQPANARPSGAGARPAQA